MSLWMSCLSSRTAYLSVGHRRIFSVIFNLVFHNIMHRMGINIPVRISVFPQANDTSIFYLYSLLIWRHLIYFINTFNNTFTILQKRTILHLMWIIFRGQWRILFADNVIQASRFGTVIALEKYLYGSRPIRLVPFLGELPSFWLAWASWAQFFHAHNLCLVHLIHPK